MTTSAQAALAASRGESRGEPAGEPVGAPAARRQPNRRLVRFLAVFGPGLVVMLADTDVGSVITAGQSGVQWGYRLLALQFVLIPILYVVQELTVRLGICTGRGHGELIRETFGPAWAWVSAAGLGIATLGALLTEFSGVAGVGELYGLPRALTLPIAAATLLAVVGTGSYRRVERAAIFVGLFELAFFYIAWAAHPDLHALLRGAASIPLGNQAYLYLVAANIGAVIMPWMVFYQQSAIADKRLRAEHFVAARWDTALGAAITQLVMAAVLIACAATIGTATPDASLNTVGEMAGALTPFLGTAVGNAVFGAGVLGAGMVAAIVASLALAWGLGEVSGYRRSLEYHPLEARWFYGVYAVCVIGGCLVVGFWPDLVALNVGVQVMNALLLPVVLGFLIALARRALPAPYRLRGGYYALVLAIAALTCGLGVFGGFSGAGLLG
ncbi:MAG: divalent metal cation transporter [Rhodospirillales bacterium]|nr:divalent metal cation transporter [Rhodospirillales bacterium]